MVKKHLLDTDALTAFFRKHPPLVARVADYLHEYDRLSVSVVTYYEVLRGLRYVDAAKQLRDLESFAADNEILPLDTPAAQRAADVYTALRRQG